LVANGGAGFGVAVEDADARAFFEKARGGGCADSTGASGDEDSFVFETAHVFELLAVGSSLLAFSPDTPDLQGRKNVRLSLVKYLESIA
jgi:hypothetical protein